MTIMAGQIITDTLATARPLPVQRPWPRYQVDAEAWSRCGDALKAGEADLLALWCDSEAVHLALRQREGGTPVVVSLVLSGRAFPSIGQAHAPALRLERTIRDLYGVDPKGCPDQRPWLDHGAWGVTAPLGAAENAPLRDPADYAFLPVRGQGLHQIPVGPVHAGIIEPGHFRFTANGETVVRLEERLGYVHKGIDRALIDCPLDRAARVAARVSGDSTVAYGFAFARAVEAALGIEVPQRAQVLRGVMAELERIANHFGDIGAICNDASFAIAHAHCGIFRECVLAICDTVFGHRLMMDRIMPGGVAADISAQDAEAIVATLDDVKPRFAEIVRLYDETPSLQDRTCATGKVSRDLVTLWAAGGYVGRASGRGFDTRRDIPYPPYAGERLEIPLFENGDVDARVWVRIREVEASIALLKRWLANLPAGSVHAEVPQVSDIREGAAMVEAFRGDVFVWLCLAAGKVVRAHLRDASCLQWPLLEAAIEGNIVADFPLCNKSFNCSYSGHDV
jgi:Ni,Fe-hydrogenase III large subunit